MLAFSFGAMSASQLVAADGVEGADGGSTDHSVTGVLSDVVSGGAGRFCYSGSTW